jgi:hypothetical protein
MNVLLVVIFISVVISGVIIGWTMMIRNSRKPRNAGDNSSDGSVGVSGPSEPPK